MAVVETSRDGPVLTITLNRPEAYNAFTTEMHAALRAALEEAAAEEVRAVVVTGAGRGFCAGQDLTEFRDLDRDVGAAPRGDLPSERPRDPRAREAGDRRGERPRRRCRALARLRVRLPDRSRFGRRSSRASSASASFPDSGGSYFLARLLGPARAFSWMTSNRRLTAAEAHAWGLVDEVVEADALAARAAELAAAYAAAPTRGIGMTKRLFDHAATATLDEQLALEAELQTAATQTDDFREGVAAFLEKRPPRFTGR